MRYKAFLYEDRTDAGGHSTREISTNFVRCAAKPVKSMQMDDDAGVAAVTTYELKFWLKDAKANGIEPGAYVVIDEMPLKITAAKPAGLGMTQWLICDADLAEDS